MDNIELWCGDCLELMKNIPDKSIDMILCDPPYGSTQNQWDKTLPLKELWENYLRVIKDNGCIAIFADGMFMAELMKSQSKLWRYNLIWNKVLTSGFLNAQKRRQRAIQRNQRSPVFSRVTPFLLPNSRYLPCSRKGASVPARVQAFPHRNTGTYNSPAHWGNMLSACVNG